MAEPIKRPGGMSIRMLVALVVLIPLVAVSAALVALSISSSRHIATDLGNQLVSDATTHVRERVVDYLEASVRMSDLYARRVENGTLPSEGLQVWNRSMLEDLSADPRVASICFANVAGDAVWLLRTTPPADAPKETTGQEFFDVGWATGKTHYQESEYITADGKRHGKIPERSTVEYIPKKRPYWNPAVELGKPTWTDIYFWFASDKGRANETGTGYTRPIYDDKKNLRGVLVIDTTLWSLSEFLRTLPAAKSGNIFLVDERGMLVAASEGDLVSTVINAHGKQERGPRITMDKGGTAAGAAAAGLVATGDGNSQQIIEFNGEKHWARVSEISVAGIKWRAVVVLPESLFMDKARSTQMRALVMAGIAVIGALLIGLMLAKKLVRPLLQLSDHVRRIGEGDFDARLHLHGARELSDLAKAVNIMAMGLKIRMQLQNSLAVATQVQQSLLPLASPTSDRLDIYGVSRYCDEAGGDYYDFIQVGDLPDERALVAIGDVMGHGIGAALLMASARAALRATALKSGALGDLLEAVNTVLARDNRHGRFMTMLLVLLEPKQGAIRWASAGHDAPMLFEPRAGEFIELEGGDVPLGVQEDVNYEEYRFPCLNPHQVLLLGTDGIWEARNAAGEMFGKERLKELVQKNMDHSAREIGHALDKALADFLGGEPARDDVTFVVVKVLPVETRLKADARDRIGGRE